MNLVLTERDGDILTITLNRPDKLNAFNPDLVEGLASALATAETDGARLVVFRANGKGFSGGFDLGDLDALSDGDLLLRFVRVEQLLQAVFHAPIPTLALCHGPCYGAAADLVAACDWRVGSEDSRFRMPGSRFGIILGTRRLTELVGPDTARQLLLRDNPFGAEEALSAGFLTRIADQKAWAMETADVHAQVTALNSGTATHLLSRMRMDNRDVDLASLVRSAAQGSIKQRIRAYQAELAA